MANSSIRPRREYLCKAEATNTSSKGLRERFRNLRERQQKFMAQHLRRLGVDHVALTTRGDVVKRLVLFFRKRERRRVA